MIRIEFLKQADMVVPIPRRVEWLFQFLVCLVIQVNHSHIIRDLDGTDEERQIVAEVDQFLSNWQVQIQQCEPEQRRNERANESAHLAGLKFRARRHGENPAALRLDWRDWSARE